MPQKQKPLYTDDIPVDDLMTELVAKFRHDAMRPEDITLKIFRTRAKCGEKAARDFLNSEEEAGRLVGVIVRSCNGKNMKIWRKP